MGGTRRFLCVLVLLASVLVPGASSANGGALALGAQRLSRLLRTPPGHVSILGAARSAAQEDAAVAALLRAMESPNWGSGDTRAIAGLYPELQPLVAQVRSHLGPASLVAAPSTSADRITGVCATPNLDPLFNSLSQSSLLLSPGGAQSGGDIVRRVEARTRDLERRISAVLRGKVMTRKHRTDVTTEEVDAANRLAARRLDELDVGYVPRSLTGTSTKLQRVYAGASRTLPEYGVHYEVRRLPSPVASTDPKGLALTHPGMPAILADLERWGWTAVVESTLPLTQTPVLADLTAKRLVLRHDSSFERAVHEWSHAEWDHYQMDDFVAAAQAKLAAGESPLGLLPGTPWSSYPRIRRAIELLRSGYPNALAIDEALAGEVQLAALRAHGYGSDDERVHIVSEYACGHLVEGLFETALTRPLALRERRQFTSVLDWLQGNDPSQFTGTPLGRLARDYRALVGSPES